MSLNKSFSGMMSCCMIMLVVYTFCFAAGSFAGSIRIEELRAHQERERLLDLFQQEGVEAVPEFKEALDAEEAFIRRTAAHLLVRLGEPAVDGIEKALENDDFQVRRIAIDGLSEMDIIVDYWPTILLDSHPSIRRDVQLVLLEKHPFPEGEEFDRLMERFSRNFNEASIEKRLHMVELITEFDFSDQIKRLLIEATRDEEERIRRTAFEHLLEYVDRQWDEAAGLLEAAETDESEDIRDIGIQFRWELLQVEGLRLPRGGWRFKKDPDGVGREKGWYEPDFDDSEWRDDVPIESSWQNHMEQTYHGAAWYRRDIEVPDLPQWDRAYLDFEGVDEEAGVWLNGEFAGSHEMGPGGWNVPFQIGVEDVLKPGQTNHIAIRAENTKGGAGIWQPVHLRVLDSTILE